MGILGNMKVLSFHSHVLTLLKYQNRYFGYGRSQRYHYGRYAMLKLPLVAPKFRLRRVKKRGKKSKKWKIAFCKNNFFFCIFTSCTLFWGSIRIRKFVWGRCARQKNFSNFGNQLRCAISEISSYGVFIAHFYTHTVQNYAWHTCQRNVTTCVIYHPRFARVANGTLVRIPTFSTFIKIYYPII